MIQVLFLLLALMTATEIRAQTVTTPAQTAIACAYNTTLPALSAGTYGLVQCDPAGNMIVSTQAAKVTCSAAFNTTAYVTPTDLAIINGSATKTVKIIRMNLSAANTVAPNYTELFFIKRSTADSGGTPTAVTPVVWDSADAACTATVTKFGSAPTTGTAVGTALDYIVVSDYPQTQLGDFGVNSKPIILRGVAEGLAMNFGGAAWPANTTLAVSITWTEE